LEELVLKAYELILLFDPALGEERVSQQTARIEEKIKSLGGAIDGVDKWGMKRLNSIVKKAKRMTTGVYILIRFQSDPAVPAQLRAFLKVTESVTRYFFSNAVVFEVPVPEKKDIAGKPMEAVKVDEIKGEPIGEPK